MFNPDDFFINKHIHAWTILEKVQRDETVNKPTMLYLCSFITSFITFAYYVAN